MTKFKHCHGCGRWLNMEQIGPDHFECPHCTYENHHDDDTRYRLKYDKKMPYIVCSCGKYFDLEN